MPHYLLAVLLYTLPVLMLLIPFVFLCHIITKNKPPQKETSPQNDEASLTKKLENLIERNNLLNNNQTLLQELEKTPTHIISAYLQNNPKSLRKYHLFQLIFTLIRNNAEDTKIIKILHHYLPSCSNSHLYALLKSYKAFLNISQKDSKNKDLLRDLNKNSLKSTLLYLEQKINDTLNQIPSSYTAMQQPLLEQTVILGLIFASFSEFYNTAVTEKILRMAYLLAPQTFLNWHQPPQIKARLNKKPPYIKLPATDQTPHQPYL